MDACEATKILLSRILMLDGKNASRILGYMLLQDDGANEVIRLASAPDALLLSSVNKVKACLGLSANAPPLPRVTGSGAHSPQPHPFHRRSYSVNDAEGGLGYRHFAKGFPNNGGGGQLGSTSEDLDDFLRLQQQSFGDHPTFSDYNKWTNFLNENQRCGPRNEFSQVGMVSSSRQIYLTFPADSAFKEEDVSSYFSTFGPVQDVRIPYQQKRMFGFVTFLYPETVKLILAKGNPHYVCDSRVLVKPYKEKGKAPDKKQFHQQHQSLERGAIDSQELFDLPIGEHARLAAESRMLFGRQEMLRRQLELEAAIELQGSRMDHLQLMDLKYQQHNNRLLPSFPAGISVSSPRQSRPIDIVGDSSDRANADVLQELDDRRESSEAVEADGRNPLLEQTESSSYNNSNDNRNWHVNDDDSYLLESLEHFLPVTLFASPTKPAAKD